MYLCWTVHLSTKARHVEAWSNGKWEPLSENIISTSNINIEHPISQHWQHSQSID